MREEKGRRWKEKENDSEGRSRRGRKGRRKGRRYASGPKPQTKNTGYVPEDLPCQDQQQTRTKTTDRMNKTNNVNFETKPSIYRPKLSCFVSRLWTWSLDHITGTVFNYSHNSYSIKQ